MAHDHAPPKVPKQMLWACGALMVFSVMLAFSGRYLNQPFSMPDEAEIARTLTMHIHDDHDGGVLVYDAETGSKLKKFDPGTGGFIRTAMRAMTSARLVRNIGPDSPFKLVYTAKGQLILFDPETERHLQLRAFGKDNAAIFADLLDLAETQPSPTNLAEARP